MCIRPRGNPLSLHGRGWRGGGMAETPEAQPIGRAVPAAAAMGRPMSHASVPRRHRRQAGLSLIELVLFIVIVSVGLAGLLNVIALTTRGSADPMVRKQALAVAESLLEEIQLKDFANPAGGFIGPATQANRPLFDDVGDYSGFATTGVFNPGGAAVPGLAGYNVAVAVAGTALGGIAAADSTLITVSVTAPNGEVVALSGYRANYP